MQPSERKPIPYGRQFIDNDDLRSVESVLKGDWLTQGPTIEAFENDLADYCGAKYAVAVSNGTAALHLVNLVLGVEAGQKVVTTPLTFVATSNSVIYAGGDPVFADVEEGSFNLSPDSVKPALDSPQNMVGMIPVHLGGLVPDLESLYTIAQNRGMWLVEDACHSVGGHWVDSKGNEHRVGDCSFSHATVFSFHPVKQITTGEGGAILTNDEKLYSSLIQLRTHGITKDPSQFVKKTDGPWYYEMQDLGFNYRMTDIQASLGITQLKKSDQWVSRRLELVTRYDQAFADLGQVRHQFHPVNQHHSYHLYILLAEQRDALFEHLLDNKVYCQVHYIPVHLQPYYSKKYGYQPGDFPIAEKYYSQALSLPLFPTLSDDDQNYVIQLIRDFYATR